MVLPQNVALRCCTVNYELDCKQTQVQQQSSKAMKKLCELCNSSANMLCESDRARLCWDCDSKVHGANFLVAKHLRILLCHICQAPTPWNASGPKLLPTISFCQNCAPRKKSDDDEESGSNHGSDDGLENQVVPLFKNVGPESTLSMSVFQ